MGIMINLDCDVFYHSRRNMADSVDEAYVRQYIDQYKDTSVSDIVFNVGGLLSSTPSNVRSTYADRALAAEQLAREKGEAFTWGCAPVVKRLNALGLDVYRIWIDRCRENGITPWISFRMNDCHNLFIEDDPLVPPEVAEHFADYSVVRHHRQIGWFDRCQDYALEADPFPLWDPDNSGNRFPEHPSPSSKLYGQGAYCLRYCGNYPCYGSQFSDPGRGRGISV